MSEAIWIGLDGASSFMTKEEVLLGGIISAGTLGVDPSGRRMDS